MNATLLFEAELRRRGIPFDRDGSGRYVISSGASRLDVCIENLTRDLKGGGNVERVAQFLDSVLAETEGDAPKPEDLYWCLEPNDYGVAPEIRVPVTPKVDRALVLIDETRGRITWATAEMLQSMGLSGDQPSETGFANLSKALLAAKLELVESGDIKLGFFSSKLPFKASLILAPNLKEVVGAALGWPLCAIAPVRDFFCLWPAAHSELITRVGPIATREYSQSPYPLSTEVYEVSDAGIRAVGAFAARS